MTPNDLTVLLCDDEQAGRDVLAFELQQIGVKSVTACASADEVLERLQAELPDLIFLDIQMPDINGIELARQLTKFHCHIVFVTAYVGFALESYDVDALDFITKPITHRKLKRALERSIERRLAQPVSLARYVVNIQDGKNMQLFSNNEILCFLAEDKYVRVSATNRELLWRQTISGLQGLLQSDFVRIHRSAIVSKNKIKSLSRKGARLELTLVDGRVLPIGKTYEADVRSTL